ncbi:MAG: hypothetical protein K2X81_27140, partial [Candidatus Obscuribacterales bacterium]|nr:hypothetical protein [Candidatus Obscuribacterales bacterium]
MTSSSNNEKEPEKQPGGSEPPALIVHEVGSDWVGKVRWLRVLQLILDISLVVFALLLAFLIRFEGSPAPEYWHQFLCMAPIFAGLRLISNWFCGVYTRLWRYTGLAEVVEIGVSTLSVTCIIFILRAIGLLAIGKYQLSYSIILIEPVLSFVLIVTARVIRRMQTEHRQRRHWRQPIRKRALVVGAGDAGQMVAKELSLRLDLGTDVVGFVDDDLRKVSTRIGNATVFGTTKDLLRFIET